MEDSAKPRGVAAAAHLSPLAGRLFDETGDRLTPSHAVKSGKRYRYYVSRRLVAGNGDADADAGWRLPADRLERDLAVSVRDHLIACLANGRLGVSEVHDIKRLRSVIETLDRTSLAMIARTTLQTGAIAIKLDARKVTSRLRLANTGITPGALTFTQPIFVRRRGIDARLVIGASCAEQESIVAQLRASRQTLSPPSKCVSETSA